MRREVQLAGLAEPARALAQRRRDGDDANQDSRRLPPIRMRQLQEGFRDEERTGAAHIHAHTGTAVRLQSVWQALQTGRPR